jgi:hypothetical protein
MENQIHPLISRMTYNLSKMRVSRDGMPYFRKSFNREFDALLSKYQEDIMPTKFLKKPSVSKDMPFVFCEVAMTESDAKNFEVWNAENSKDMFPRMEECALNGYKLSLVWDMQNECYIATYSCQDDASPNYRSSVSSRSDDAIEAICLLHYKVYIKLDGLNWRERPTRTNWG